MPHTSPISSAYDERVVGGRCVCEECCYACISANEYPHTSADVLLAQFPKNSPFNTYLQPTMWISLGVSSPPFSFDFIIPVAQLKWAWIDVTIFESKRPHIYWSFLIENLSIMLPITYPIDMRIEDNALIDFSLEADLKNVCTRVQRIAICILRSGSWVETTSIHNLN